MALFADCLDHVEWKTDSRMDGTAMSIYNIIAVAMVGIMTGVFNLLLAKAGYQAPFTATSVADAMQKITEHNEYILANADKLKDVFLWASQIELESIKPVDGVLTVALQQPDKVYWVMTFAFVGLEVFTSITAFVLLFLLKVEKTIGKEQAEIKARHEE